MPERKQAGMLRGMVGLGIGLGLSLGSQHRPPAQPKLTNGGPELLLQTEFLQLGNKTAEGTIIQSVGILWNEIVEHLGRDPQFLLQFTQHHRKFEEFIAACYERQGFEVILTPRSGDGGVDVIATMKGFGSVRFLEQTKAYSPGHLVSHDDVRAMLGTLATSPNASKGLISTTSDFQPGVLKPDSQFAPYMPHRLELKNGAQVLEWARSIHNPNG